MTQYDLVVVLPGIMGSALAIDGTPVWDVAPGSLLRGLLQAGRNLMQLEVRQEIGTDGVTATRLLPSVHVIPGIWTPVHGYTELLVGLRAWGFSEQRGNMLPLPYDWRHGIPDIVRSISKAIEDSLTQLRRRGGPYADAQIIFVAHSMGGLVARRYAANQGSAPVRRIVTIGTPQRGALDALEKLIHGPVRDRFRWARSYLLPDLHRLARTLPGLHHLLPAYACVGTAGVPEFLDPWTFEGLHRDLAVSGLNFYNKLEEDEGEALGTRLVPIIGRRQTTATTCSIDAQVISPTYSGQDYSGDGTVPVPSSIPRGWTLDDPRVHSYAERHGILQMNERVLHRVRFLITDTGRRFRRPKRLEIWLDLPEFVFEGDFFDIVIGAERQVNVLVTITTENGRSSTARSTANPTGVRFEVSGLPIGMASVSVTNNAESPDEESSVGGLTLVWPAGAP